MNYRFFFLLLIAATIQKGYCQTVYKTIIFNSDSLINENTDKSKVPEKKIPDLKYRITNDSFFYLKVEHSKDTNIHISITYTDQTGEVKNLDSLNKLFSLKGRDYFLFNINIKYKCKIDSLNTNKDDKAVTIGRMVDTQLNIHAYVYKIIDTIPNPSFVMFSLIKTIAGQIVKDELVDIFMKINYGRQKRFFSMIGADVSLSNGKDSNSTSGVFRLNEALANVNWALNKPEGDDKNGKKLLATRTIFFGAGLKIFSSVAYIGSHFGSIETSGPFLGSYISGGYYYSPYIYGQKKVDTGGINTFRHNVYIEAAINIPVLKESPIRIKFGLMLPIADGKNNEGDTINPAGKDILSRLSIEAPLGGIIKFW